MTLQVRTITISSKSEMLDCVKTRERITIVLEPTGQLRYIDLVEDHIGNDCALWPYVKYFDRPECRYVRHESVNTRAYIYMLDGAILENLFGNVEVLIKIVSRHTAT
jgi:hypothetical protein